MPASRKVFAVALFLLGAVIPTRESLWHCRHCCNDWPIAG